MNKIVSKKNVQEKNDFSYTIVNTDKLFDLLLNQNCTNCNKNWLVIDKVSYVGTVLRVELKCMNCKKIIKWVADDNIGIVMMMMVVQKEYSMKYFLIKKLMKS